VQAWGIQRCFSSEPIGDSTFARMIGKTWKKDCPLKRSDFRYLRIVHCNAEGHPQMGEMVCHRQIAAVLLRIFRELYEAGYRIERMQLMDDFNADDETAMRANNTSCFNYRTISGTKRISKHGMGLAVDINTLYNPYVVTRKGKTHVEPTTGRKYAFNRDKRKDIPYKIDRNDLAYKLFTKNGFKWGGAWQYSKDYQHFEYKQSIKN